jgi:hypothetical protein
MSPARTEMIGMAYLAGTGPKNLAAEIQADPILRGTPLVFLTALVSQREAKGGAQRIGEYPFFAKPVDSEIVLASIEHHARKSD